MSDSKYDFYYDDDEVTDIEGFYDEEPLLDGTDWVDLYGVATDNTVEPEKATPKPYTKVEPVKDISDWRTWRHQEPGHCPCGISRTDCTYHK